MLWQNNYNKRNTDISMGSNKPLSCETQKIKDTNYSVLRKLRNPPPGTLYSWYSKKQVPKPSRTKEPITMAAARTQIRGSKSSTPASRCLANSVEEM